jgi:plastocyanin domain-containing protein
MKQLLIILGSFAIAFVIILVSFSSSSVDGGDAVRTENDVQIIHVLARGGYTPSQITAKAGVPTRLEIETKGTYDCSAAFVIPQLSYQKMLPSSGVTTLDLGVRSSGSSLTGLCAMGMYSLQIRFE